MTLRRNSLYYASEADVRFFHEEEGLLSYTDCRMSLRFAAPR
jgi:hypothetical protein